MAKPAGKLQLEPRRLFLVLPCPILVISVSFLLIRFGMPAGPLAKAAAVNGHAEAVGRLRMLSTWLLLLVINVTCIYYFIQSLRLFDDKSWRLLVGTFAALALFGSLGVAYGMGEGPRLLGESEICAAFGAPPPAARRAGPAPAGKDFQSYDPLPKEELRWFRPPRCATDPGNRSMAWMWRLNLLQRLLLALVSPALVLGTIACVARPAGGDGVVEARMRLDRLKAHLYLAATVFVSGLLFLSALLRWPAAGFTQAGAAAYLAHVDAFVLYWGVTYSLYIASYYVPAAWLLAQDSRKAGIAEKDLPSVQPSEIAKAMAALFAPLVAALLGNVLHL